MAKHTPGPWACEDGEVFYADGDVQPLIATVHCDNAQTHGQYLGDCYLIAAAPEMLDALKIARANLSHMGDGCSPENCSACRSDAAIAKATGTTMTESEAGRRLLGSEG